MGKTKTKSTAENNNKESIQIKISSTNPKRMQAIRAIKKLINAIQKAGEKSKYDHWC
jgi:hypothetical protein